MTKPKSKRPSIRGASFELRRRSHARAEMHSYSVRVNNVLSFAVSVWMVLCAMATASGEFRYPRANERAAPAIDF